MPDLGANFFQPTVLTGMTGEMALASEETFGPVAGLFAFDTMEHILSAIEELRRDYRRHARAARAIAEEHLDSDKVLTRLLAQIGFDS